MRASLDLANEERNKNVGLIVTAILHLLLTLICFTTLFTRQIPPPLPANSVVINFQEVEEEEGISTQGESAPADAPEEIDQEEPQEPITKPTKEVKSTPTKPTPKPVQSKTTVNEADVIAAKKKAAETEAKRKADEQAKKEQAIKEAEAKKQAELDAKKKKFGDLLGKGGNSTNGQDVKEGDPDATALENMSKGSGTLGKGLTSRTVIFEPAINENSQKTGKVVVSICINQEGKVISAKYTQKGSTTTDADLVKLAEKGAKKYLFSKSEAPEQCGEILIEFKVK